VCDFLVLVLSDLSFMALVILQANVIDLLVLEVAALLDGLEQWKLRSLQEDCECGPVFL
jgi:hypothetical protein